MDALCRVAEVVLVLRVRQVRPFHPQREEVEAAVVGACIEVGHGVAVALAERPVLIADVDAQARNRLDAHIGAQAQRRLVIEQRVHPVVGRPLAVVHVERHVEQVLVGIRALDAHFHVVAPALDEGVGQRGRVAIDVGEEAQFVLPHLETAVEVQPCAAAQVCLEACHGVELHVGVVQPFVGAVAAPVGRQAVEAEVVGQERAAGGAGVEDVAVGKGELGGHVRGDGDAAVMTRREVDADAQAQAHGVGGQPVEGGQADQSVALHPVERVGGLADAEVQPHAVPFVGGIGQSAAGVEVRLRVTLVGTVEVAAAEVVHACCEGILPGVARTGRADVQLEAAERVALLVRVVVVEVVERLCAPDRLCTQLGAAEAVGVVGGDARLVEARLPAPVVGVVVVRTEVEPVEGGVHVQVVSCREAEEVVQLPGHIAVVAVAQVEVAARAVGLERLGGIGGHGAVLEAGEGLCRPRILDVLLRRLRLFHGGQEVDFVRIHELRVVLVLHDHGAVERGVLGLCLCPRLGGEGEHRRREEGYVGQFLFHSVRGVVS